MFTGILSTIREQNNRPLPQRNVETSMKARIAVTWIFAVAIMALLTTTTATAQKYESLPIADEFVVDPVDRNATPLDLKEYRKNNKQNQDNRKEGENALEDVLENGGNLSGSPGFAYLKGYVFPAMTQTDTESISKYGEWRTDFLESYLDEKVTGSTRQQLLSETITETKAISANKNLHPAARLNAVYLLGQLNSVAPSRTTTPVPSEAALAELVQIFTTNDNAAFPQYLQIAALAGIQRNFALRQLTNQQIDGATRDQVLTRINDSLSKPIDPNNAAISYWLKRRSMQVGGIIGNEMTVTQIIATLMAKDEKFWLQMDALDAIGNIDPQSIGAKNKEASIAVTKFCVEALAGEADKIKAAVDQLVYDNILFSDVDFEETGTNFDKDTAAETGEGAGTSGGSPGGKFGGAGASAGGPGGAGFGGAGGGGAVVTADPVSPRLELPNYQLQTIRSRIKAIAFKAIKALGDSKTKGMRRFLDTETESSIDSVVTYLERVLRESNIGIIDRDVRDRNKADENPKVSFTQQLIDGCKEWAKDIGDVLAKMTDAPAAGAIAAPAGAGGN